jgi:hypothetical protein
LTGANNFAKTTMFNYKDKSYRYLATLEQFHYLERDEKKATCKLAVLEQPFMMIGDGWSRPSASLALKID